MKVRVGDNVLVLAGKDKGKSGKVIKTIKKLDKVVVEGVNITTKHQKPSRTNESGSIVKIEYPIHVSNVKVATEKAAKKETVKKVVEKKETKKKASK